MTLLIVDSYFMFHRARSGFDKGEFPVVFNFFRGLKALVDLHSPCKLVLVLEGEPKARFAMMPEYKQTRIVDPNIEPEKHAKLVDFHRQKDEIINILRKMPVMLIRHPDFECDDIIADLAVHTIDEIAIIASGDSDFIQLLGPAHPRIQLYHPIRKEFVSASSYDYVTWKALRGDGSDNISGIPGIGDKTAEKLVLGGQNDLDVFLNEVPSRRDRFIRNLEMIRFHELSGDDRGNVELMGGFDAQWSEVESDFLRMGFNSFFKGHYFANFQQTFHKSKALTECVKS